MNSADGFEACIFVAIFQVFLMVLEAFGIIGIPAEAIAAPLWIFITVSLIIGATKKDKE